MSGTDAPAAGRPGVADAQRRMAWLLAGLATAAYLWVAAYMAFNGALNVDEGFYGLCARAAVSGYVPYRDFGYTQTPLFLYVSGLEMKLIGFGFLKQRLADAVWGFAAAVLGMTYLWRRANRWAGLTFIALVVSGLHWMYFANIGKTDGFVGLIMLAAAVATVSGLPYGRKIALVSLLGVIGVGCRLPSAAFFAVLWAGLAASARSPIAIAKAFLWPAAGTLVLIVPFIALAPRNFYFWTIAFHMISRGVKAWHMTFANLLYVSPACCLGSAAIAIFAMARRVEVPRTTLLVIIAIAASIACNVLPKGSYPEYSAPLVPTGLLVLILVLSTAQVRRRFLWASAALALLLVANLCVKPPIDSDIYRNTRRAAEIYSRLQSPPFAFAGSASAIALESDAPVVPGMTMSPFCCTSTLTEAAAAQLHLETPEDIAALMLDPRCKVILVYTDPVRNFVWSMPTFDLIPAKDVDRWKAILAGHYALQYGDSTYAAFVRVR